MKVQVNKVEVEEVIPEVVEHDTDLDLKEFLPDVIDDVTKAMIIIKKQEEIVKNAKDKILDAMEKNGIKKFSNEFINITYVAPTTRTTIDSTKLKKRYPEIAEECQKTSNVKSSVRIKVN